eukprot:gnl/MRDRNA2_/MRDRNA2_82184_c0_seq2.p1 gnl/MRDRNA2_/MRDRNA2_82184_c0~~gnl/MRDRNA2_/MRDRNA2_82184_c0_seq2.p1  ORF type:complete len:369 (+),score=73.18 gnl/MRDRNA2_/MRDRNA2_82184_c0_seq2:44-1150(+)
MSSTKHVALGGLGGFGFIAVLLLCNYYLIDMTHPVQSSRTQSKPQGILANDKDEKCDPSGQDPRPERVLSMIRRKASETVDDKSKDSMQQQIDGPDGVSSMHDVWPDSHFFPVESRPDLLPPTSLEAHKVTKLSVSTEDHVLHGKAIPSVNEQDDAAHTHKLHTDEVPEIKLVDQSAKTNMEDAADLQQIEGPWNEKTSAAQSEHTDKGDLGALHLAKSLVSGIGQVNEHPSGARTARSPSGSQASQGKAEEAQSKEAENPQNNLKVSAAQLNFYKDMDEDKLLENVDEDADHLEINLSRGLVTTRIDCGDVGGAGSRQESPGTGCSTLNRQAPECNKAYSKSTLGTCFSCSHNQQTCQNDGDCNCPR